MVRAHIAQFLAFQLRHNKSWCLYIYITIIMTFMFDLLTNVADMTYRPLGGTAKGQRRERVLRHLELKEVQEHR